MEYRFPAYGKSPGVVIGYVVWLACLVPLAFMPIPDLWQLLIPVLFILFFGYVLAASTFKLFTTYFISESGLRIYKPPFSELIVPHREIQQVALVSNQEAEELLRRLLMDQNRFAESADLAGYVAYLKKNSPVYKYFTFAPAVSTTSVGPRELLTSVKIKSAPRFVILTFGSGKVLFLSPRDPSAFMQRYEALKPSEGST